MKRKLRSKRQNDRGSALLVSLMVIVGLSLLGLGFVTISETETVIAKNQQGALQTLAVAEAGGKLVVEWFQDPTWAVTVGGCPSNNPATNANIGAIKTTRKYPIGSTVPSGVYKPSATDLLFDKPYRPGASDRFWADENTGDIVINRTTDATTIDNVNNILLGTTPDDRRGGEITEIRVYAPPMAGGSLVGNGTNNPDGTPQQFWSGQTAQRFGVATIKVTAVLFRDPSLTGANRTAPANIMATHAVRLVIGELPLPIPGGPIQSNTSISFGGDFIVHWGNETSTQTLTNKRNPSSLPWANAYERSHIEHGYEPGSSVATVTITNGGSGYTSNPTVTIDVPCTWNAAGNNCVPCNAGAGCVRASASATVSGGVVTAVTFANAAAHGAGYMALPDTINGVATGQTNWGPTVTFSGGGGTGASAIASVGAEVWPILTTASNFDNADYFHEVLNKPFEDLWFGSRAGGNNQACGTNTSPMCNSYSFANDEQSTANAPYTFQTQNVNNYPYQKKVVFPSIKYDFWKRIASQGRGYKGIYYFKYDKVNGGFMKGGSGTSKPMAYWANSLPMTNGKGGSGLGPGVYFFDTVDAVNPQTLTGSTRTAQLTPSEVWKASDFNGAFLMVGFIYVNATSWGTDGSGSAPTSVQANFPGEPFRDIGYPLWDKTKGDWDKTCGGQICRTGAGDGIFSCQELNGNNQCDIVVMPAPAYRAYDPAMTTSPAGTGWVVKTWKSDPVATIDYGQPCTIPLPTYDGTNARASDCSEPHEPYLNIIFPATDCKQGSNCLTVGWEAPGSQTYRPKITDINGNPVSCASPTQANCTSNARDNDGALVPLSVMLDGVFYNEGDYKSQGNDTFYGSLLIQGGVTGTGTPDIWFDEKLIKGTWAPPNMPRVIVYNEQTDEQQQ